MPVTIKTAAMKYKKPNENGYRSIDGIILNENPIECGSGKQYTRLRDAIAKGVELGRKVIVYSGTYNLVNEFATEISAQSDPTGIELGNNVEVVFLSGAKVTAIFDNSSRWIYENFQPFYSKENGSFILNGLDIEAQNTRYCVHDDHVGVGTYYHIFKNCKMKYTTTHTANINYVQCIGGGLGEHGYIEIDGGYYESINTNDTWVEPISYHNGKYNTCFGRIVIKDLYLAGAGRIRFGDYGPSTLLTPVLICDCSMGANIVHQLEAPEEYTAVNFSITEWNNIVRT